MGARRCAAPLPPASLMPKRAPTVSAPPNAAGAEHDTWNPMRPPSGSIPAARLLHEKLIDLGVHQGLDVDHAGFSAAISPCDGCVDLADLVLDRYALVWQGPRAEQRR